MAEKPLMGTWAIIWELVLVLPLYTTLHYLMLSSHTGHLIRILALLSAHLKTLNKQYIMTGIKFVSMGLFFATSPLSIYVGICWFYVDRDSWRGHEALVDIYGTAEASGTER